MVCTNCFCGIIKWIQSFNCIIKWIQSFNCYQIDDDYEENSSESKFTKPPSLMNIGANCYLNSALQGISSCDKFLEELSQLHEEYEDLEKLSLFHKLIDILNGGKSDYLEISCDPIFRNWNKPGQQDSFELLAYVMNQVYNDIRKYLENEEKIPKRDMQRWLEVKLPMRIIIEYEIKCSCGRKVEVPLQSDLALHVAIPSQKDLDLQRLVHRFFQVDEIEDYKCDNENCDGKNTKRFTRLVRPLPKTLCIHLQRTYWNGRKIQKIDDTIKFSVQLKIKSEFSVKQNNTNSNSAQVQAEDDIYNLTSIIVHHGSVDGGHYVCYKKMNDKWFLTDDSSIRKASENEVLNCKAYILFYEKQ